ncbi:MAG: alpha/beta fold hydrolase [Nitrososphaeraceae archaeon]
MPKYGCLRNLWVIMPVFIALAFLLIILTTTMFLNNNSYFGTTNNLVYGQSDLMNSNVTNSLNIQNIPVKRVHVGDIDIAYKVFGKGDPILLISAFGAPMDGWEPSTLRELSSNHTVIIFDNRGVGNTTTGTKPFSIQQFANDTAGLLDGLKIQKADVLGFSMGSFVAQQLTVTHPEKVNRLILYGASCGGKEGISPSPEVIKLTKKHVNSIVSNTPIEPQEVKTIVSLGFGPTWIKLHPNFLETIPTASNLKDLILSGITPNAYMQQFNAVLNWYATNWSGVCSQLPNISKPTLVITGTEDVSVPAANSLIIAAKIPGAWLVQIQAAGHELMSQHPDKFNKVLQTFLATTISPN